MPIHPNNPIIAMTKAKPPAAMAPLSHLMIASLIQLLLPTPLLVASETNPANHNCTCSNPPYDANLPCVCNQCGFCKDTCTIEWAVCKMQSPATGTQTAKDHDALPNTANPPKPCAPPASSGLQSDLPPHHSCDPHYTYHVENSQCSSQ